MFAQNFTILFIFAHSFFVWFNFFFALKGFLVFSQLLFLIPFLSFFGSYNLACHIQMIHFSSHLLPSCVILFSSGCTIFTYYFHLCSHLRLVLILQSNIFNSHQLFFVVVKVFPVLSLLGEIHPINYSSKRAQKYSVL